MDNKDETSFKPFLDKNIKRKRAKHKTNKNTSLFMSKTFASKLFLKLTSKMIDPIIVCLQTLKFEPENRKKEEIENTIPYLKTLDNFNDYIHFREKEESSFNLMVQFARITFYQYYRKHTILKRPGSSNDKFYILLNGCIEKFSLVFEKVNLTIEQYLLYLLKMEIINEKEIIKKCHILNKSIINIGDDELSIINFFKNIKKLNYKDMQIKAEKDLRNLGFNSDLFHNGILRRAPSIENYLKIFEFPTAKIIENDGKPRFNIWIGKYKLNSVLVKGQFFNNISEEAIKEYNMYICRTNCDIGQITRQEFCEHELNLLIKLKMQNTFKEIKNEFYFLRGINDDKFIQDYSYLLLYKKYKKGDKIFLQGGLYEGVYLIYDGEISLSTKTNLDKLSHLVINIVFSIKNFTEHIPAFDSRLLIEEFNDIHQLLYKRGDAPFTEFLNTRNIDISKVKKNDILGLNELYDYKTELFNFTAECISDEATLFFITKNDFSLMLGKETNLRKNILSMVEYKIQSLVGVLRSYSEQALKVFERQNKKINSIKTNSASNILDKNKLNSSIYSKSKFNSSKFNSSNIFDSSKFNSSKINNSSLYTLKSNSSIRNYHALSPSPTYSIRKEKEINKKNNETELPMFYKTLNNKRTNSNFKKEYIKYNSLNDVYSKRKLINNDLKTFLDNKTQNNFNSINSKIFPNDNSFNTFRGRNMLSRYIEINNDIFANNSNNINLLYNSNNQIKSIDEKRKKFDKIKLFPILRNRVLHNNEIKNKRLLFK